MEQGPFHGRVSADDGFGMDRKPETPAGSILVIDDDAELCKLVSRFLGAEGFKVQAVQTGGQFSRFETWPFELGNCIAKGNEEVPEQLACPRFNCNTNQRASYSPGWRTAEGEDGFR